MILRLIFILAIVFGQPSVVLAQINHGEEVEVGNNGKGTWSYSHFFFFDSPAYHASVRPFWVENITKRIEVGAGPTFKHKSFVFKPSLGFTTDGEIMLVGWMSGKVGTCSIVYLADSKLGLGEPRSSLYQKTWVSFPGKNSWLTRYEQMHVSSSLVFARIGIEHRRSLPLQKPAHLYFFPFFDMKGRRLGAEGGLRFSNLEILKH